MLAEESRRSSGARVTREEPLRTARLLRELRSYGDEGGLGCCTGGVNCCRTGAAGAAGAGC